MHEEELRDHFAGLAMQRTMQLAVAHDWPGPCDFENAAELAYEMAEQMLKVKRLRYPQPENA